MPARNAILVAVPAYVATAATAGAQPSGSYTHDPHMWGGWGWGGMILGPIMMILFIAAAVAVVVLVLRALGRVDRQPGKAGPPSMFSKSVLSGSMVLSVVGTCPPHDGVRVGQSLSVKSCEGEYGVQSAKCE